MVGPFYFALHSRLAGIAGRNKPLINMKAHLQRCAFCLSSFGSGFKVQGSRGGFAAFFIGRCPKVVFKSRVISHNNDMSSPLEKGRAKGAGWICPAGASFYVADNVLLAGIVSHVWHEILRLSPHLFWLGVFTQRAFSSVQDDDTGGADGLSSGRYVACFGTSGVILRYE